MSENISNELPVITSIDDLPETAIAELTGGNEPEVVEDKPVTKAKTSQKSEPVAEVTEVHEVAEASVKPKRKRRTKAEIEAEKAAKASEAGVNRNE